MQAAVLGAINRERAGEQVNQSLVRAVAQMLMDLGEDVYVHDFEEPFLATTVRPRRYCLPRHSTHFAFGIIVSPLLLPILLLHLLPPLLRRRRLLLLLLLLSRCRLLCRFHGLVVLS